MPNKIFFIDLKSNFYIDLRNLQSAQTEWYASNWYEKTTIPIISDQLWSESELRAAWSGFLFSPDFIQQLGGQMEENGENVFHEGFLNFLQRFKFDFQLTISDENLKQEIKKYTFAAFKIQWLLAENAVKSILLVSPTDFDLRKSKV